MTEKKFTPIIRLDFDGVIHSYDTPNNPWDDAFIPDPVTPGFWRWAVEAERAGFKLVVFSSRCKTVLGREAISNYLRKQWYSFAENPENSAWVDMENAGRMLLGWAIDIVDHPVPAYVTIDDRGLTFNGRWEDFSPDVLRRFRPWNKR